MNAAEKVFEDIGKEADAEDTGITEIESLCVNCEENGVTKLLLCKIPFYRDVILMSFECEHCGFKNNEIQSGAPALEHGVKLVLSIANANDLNRQIVKSEYATVSVPLIEFEVPPTKHGEITTVEGLLTRSYEMLELSVRHYEPSVAAQVAVFLSKLKSLLALEESFTLVIDDPSGNSHIEPLAEIGHTDTQLTKINYRRSFDQEKLLGFVADDAEEQAVADASSENSATENFKDEVLQFAVNCSNCNAPTQTNMKLVDIPHFKQVIIMATACSSCGVRTNEVKSGAGVSEEGVRHTLSVETAEDLSRDVLKSETCDLRIPELELEVGAGAVSGRFTTVEGIFTGISDQLRTEGIFASGDSATDNKKKELQTFLGKLADAAAGKIKVHLILDDPAGNSYIQSLVGAKLDERLNVERYTRSFQQNDDLGLNDMNV